MNRALLDELQRRRAYPSVTVLLNTTAATPLTAAEFDVAARLIAQVDERLTGDVGDDVRAEMLARLEALLGEQAALPSSHALALFVSPDYQAAVRLGRAIEERVTIDDTFTTRDLVADLNRTALYRVIAVSERVTRLFVGDRQRLVEQRDDGWPLTRNDEHTSAAWVREVNYQLRAEFEQGGQQLPTVVAGVQRSVRRLVPRSGEMIGIVPGNHDRTSATDLHHAAWPLVTDWLRADATRALNQLDSARSTHRYAGGIHEVWSLARDGRVDTLVVESGFALAARIDDNGQLHPADDPTHPDVFDDVVDDTIEAVLRLGGSAVIVNGGVLDDHQRIAAILRY